MQIILYVCNKPNWNVLFYLSCLLVCWAFSCAYVHRARKCPQSITLTSEICLIFFKDTIQILLWSIPTLFFRHNRWVSYTFSKRYYHSLMGTNLVYHVWDIIFNAKVIGWKVRFQFWLVTGTSMHIVVLGVIPKAVNKQIIFQLTGNAPLSLHLFVI